MLSFFKKNIYCIICFLLIVIVSSSCASLVMNTEPFDVLETSHFTFFYRESDEAVVKDLKQIAKYCESGIVWLSAYLGFEIELKPDIYLFDEVSSSFKEPFSNIDLVSHSINGTIVYYYVEQNYLAAASVILHEAVHVIQDFYYSLDNTALAEGIASFLSLKFYNYYIGTSYLDSEILNLLNTVVLQGIMDGDGLPEDLLTLSLPDFNRTDILNTNRNVGARYEIMESFIAYLVKNYGINSVAQWQNETTISNFKNQFFKSIGVSFDKCQSDWLADIGACN